MGQGVDALVTGTTLTVSGHVSGGGGGGWGGGGAIPNL